MSKLLRAINPYKTNDRFYKLTQYSPLDTVSNFVEITQERNLCSMYKFRASIGVDVKISEEAIIKEPNVLEHVESNVRKQVAEEIFGEFKLRLLKLQRAFMVSGDTENVKVVTSILDDMFKV